MKLTTIILCLSLSSIVKCITLDSIVDCGYHIISGALLTATNRRAVVSLTQPQSFGEVERNINDQMLVTNTFIHYAPELITGAIAGAISYFGEREYHDMVWPYINGSNN